MMENIRSVSPAKLLLIGISIALLASLGNIFEHERSNAYSFKIFSDWDETSYFAFAKQIAVDSSSIFDLAKPEYWPERHNPNNYTDYVIGELLLFSEIPSTTLAVLLDLFCVTFSFVALFVILRPLSKDSSTTYLSATMALFFPWLIFPLTYLPDTLVSVGPFTLSPHETFPSTAPLRAIHTQLSFLVFLLSLGLTHTIVKTPKRYTAVFLSAFATASLLYIYVFAWLSAAAITSLMLVGLFPKHGKDAAYAVLLWGTTFLAFSYPGLQMILVGSSLDAQFWGDFGQTFSQVFYLPVEKLALFCFLLVLTSNSDRIEEQNITPKTLLLYIILADTFLTNLQAIEQTWLAPYHFSMFFLNPLFTGVFISALLSTFSFPQQKERIRLYTWTAIACVSLMSFKHYTFPWEKSDHTYDGLFETISKLVPSDKIIGVPMYRIPHTSPDSKSLFAAPLPYLVDAIGNRKVVGKSLSASALQEHFIGTELGMSWYLTGKIQLGGKCIWNAPSVTPDVIRNATKVIQYIRFKACAVSQAVSAKLTPCEILQKMPLDYLVRTIDLSQKNTSSNEKAYTRVWKSPNNYFELLKIDADSLREEFCFSRSGKLETNDHTVAQE